MRRGTCSKLSQNTSTIAAIIRLSATRPGRFSSRLMVGCEHRSAPLSGSRPTAILKAGSDFSASQSLPPAFAGTGSGIARRDQQGPVADHLAEAVAHPFRRSWVLDAIGQALGDPEPLLDRRQQQYPGVRGQPAAVESDMHRLARDRWQTRQNPRTFVHGGRELRWPRLIRFEQPNHTRIQRLVSLPPGPSCSLMNYPG